MNQLIKSHASLAHWVFVTATLTDASGNVLLCRAAESNSVTNQNPYSAIYERNVLALRQPPPPPVQPRPNLQLPKIILNGITTILGDKRALLTIQVPATPPAKPRLESRVLKEGQKRAGVEIIEIDETARKVIVKNSGVLDELDFKKNGDALRRLPPALALPRPGIRATASTLRRPTPIPATTARNPSYRGAR